jgi:transcriptional regulator with XRE-family HTH domain
MSPLTKTKAKVSASEADSERLVRFAKALRQAMIVNEISERRMAAMLGITSGTTQKYFRGEVDPLKVGTGVNRGLARLLGVSLDQLVDYYETGSYAKEMDAGLSFEKVASWMQSSDGIEHIGSILQAAAKVCQRGAVADLSAAAPAAPLKPFTWPLEELKSAGVSEALQERMGLTVEALRALVEDGQFDEELVEAFSVATNLDPKEVHKAFKGRKAIPQE